VGDTTRLHSWYRYDLAGRLYWTRNFVVTPHPNLYEWTGDYYFYNAKGKILEDSSVTSVFADTNSITNPTEKWEYTYNTAGTLTDVFNSDFSGAWFLITHYIIAYAAANQIKSVYQYNAGPYLYQIDSFSYAPGIPYYTFHSDSSFDASTSITSFQESDQKFVNASGLVDSMIYLQPNYKVVHYYNYTALGNPFSDSITIFNADTLTSETMVHYYYEPIPTAVQSVSNPTSDIQVYPNPAAAELYFHSETKIASVRLSLYNAQGQQVVCTALPMSSGYAQFNIAHLTQGIYFLTLTDENGGSIKKQTIVKL